MRQRVLALLQIHPGEGRAVFWGGLYVFALFLAYYTLRPLRDAMGAAGDTENLSWLFTATMLAMLAIVPLFGACMRRWARRQAVATVTRCFALQLPVFAALMALLPAEGQVWLGRVFFVWTSVFNLCVVSLFWSSIVDLFDAAQGPRLFPLFAAGATLGGIAGSAASALLAALPGQALLPLLSAVLLEAAVQAARRLFDTAPDAQMRTQPGEAPLGGGVLAGLTHTLRSPYLLGIALFVVLYSVTSTFLYFQQAAIAAANFPDRAARTVFFARIDLAVNAGTLAVQLLLSARLMRRLGTVGTLAVLPGLSVAGFALLAAAPGPAALVAVQIARRIGNFALARPAREILFTATAREDRYKAKNFIDTAVYRGGDQLAAWGYAGLAALELSMAQLAAVAVPLSLAWLALACGLGRATQARAQARERAASAGAALPAGAGP